MIQKLQQYGNNHGGLFVLADKARSREDALLEALKNVTSSSMSVEDSYPQARKLIREIKETQ